MSTGWIVPKADHSQRPVSALKLDPETISVE
jgi:hypothetical protein